MFKIKLHKDSCKNLSFSGAKYSHLPQKFLFDLLSHKMYFKGKFGNVVESHTRFMLIFVFLILIFQVAVVKAGRFTFN